VPPSTFTCPTLSGEGTGDDFSYLRKALVEGGVELDRDRPFFAGRSWWNKEKRLIECVKDWNNDPIGCAMQGRIRTFDDLAFPISFGLAVMGFDIV
jgi:hypothetical protein